MGEVKRDGEAEFRYFNRGHRIHDYLNDCLSLRQLPLADLNLLFRSSNENPRSANAVPLYEDEWKFTSMRSIDHKAFPLVENMSLSAYDSSVLSMVAEYDRFVQDVVRGIDGEHFRREMIKVVESSVVGEDISLFHLLSLGASEDLSSAAFQMTEKSITDKIASINSSLNANCTVDETSAFEFIQAYVMAIRFYSPLSFASDGNRPSSRDLLVDKLFDSFEHIVREKRITFPFSRYTYQLAALLVGRNTSDTMKMTMLQSILHATLAQVSREIHLLSHAGLVRCYVPNGTFPSVNLTFIERAEAFSKALSEEVKFVYQPLYKVVVDQEEEDEEYVPEGHEVMSDAMVYPTENREERIQAELKQNRFSYSSLTRLKWMSDVTETLLENLVGHLHLIQLDPFCKTAHAALVRFGQEITVIREQVEEEFSSTCAISSEIHEAPEPSLPAASTPHPPSPSQSLLTHLFNKLLRRK
jgi:hypothetical protein